MGFSRKVATITLFSAVFALRTILPSAGWFIPVGRLLRSRLCLLWRVIPPLVFHGRTLPTWILLVNVETVSHSIGTIRAKPVQGAHSPFCR